LSLERIYLGLIRPILEYGDIIWHSPNELLNSLETVQLNAARIVVGATARCRTQGLYDETAWEPLAKRREHHRLTMMNKIMNGKAPQYLIDLAPEPVHRRTQYQLRNRDNIDVPITRLNILANSFFPSTSRLWNDLDQVAKSRPSVGAFKAHHRSQLPKKNPLYFYGGRLESAIHARMRIGNSPLKADLCNTLHVIDSPLCPSCGTGANETAKHFFFNCNLFATQRDQLKQDLLPHIINQVDHLLYGLPDSDHLVNTHVFDAVHKYIRDTKRFY
jgi:hypothetical protein